MESIRSDGGEEADGAAAGDDRPGAAERGGGSAYPGKQEKIAPEKRVPRFARQEGNNLGSLLRTCGFAPCRILVLRMFRARGSDNALHRGKFCSVKVICLAKAHLFAANASF